MNKPYFVHHKEEMMSSVFSSAYVRAAFSGASGNRRKAGQRLSSYQPQSTHFQVCQSRGTGKSWLVGFLKNPLWLPIAWYKFSNCEVFGSHKDSSGAPFRWVFRTPPIEIRIYTVGFQGQTFWKRESCWLKQDQYDSVGPKFISSVSELLPSSFCWHLIS